MPSSSTEPTIHHTYCRVCHAGCGLRVTIAGDEVLKVDGDPGHPLSDGYTCPKGRAIPWLHHRPDRLDRPELRSTGGIQPVSWQACLDDVAERVRQLVGTHGPDSVGMFHGTGSAFDAMGSRVSDRFLRRLGSRSSYSTVTVDMPNKLLVAELMSGNPLLNPVLDYESARLVVLIGTNPLVSHGHTTSFANPVTRLRRLKSQGELWVIDPRTTATARTATRHLAPRGGTDYAVLGYLVRELLHDGADSRYLETHTTGVGRLAAAVEHLTRERAAELAGLAPGDLSDLLGAVRRAGRVAIQTGTGVSMNPSGNVTEWLAWVVQAITGSFERPGGNWFNPGYLRRFDKRTWTPATGTPDQGPQSRPELPRRWGQYPVAALEDEIRTGRLRGLFVVGANPVTSAPGGQRFVEALRSLDLLVVSDIVRSDTAQLATHLFPCADMLERADLPTGVDNYLPAVTAQYTPALLDPAHERKPMWWPYAQLGQRLGLTVLPDGLDPDTCSDDDLLAPVADRGRSDFATLRAAGTALSEPFERGWVERQVLPDARWRLAPDPLVGQLARLQTPAPLVLLPRRQRQHFNSHLREGAGRQLRPDEPTIDVHPHDAAQSGVADGQQVRLRSSHGELRGTVRVDPAVARGGVSVPHGYAEPNVAGLTSGKHRVDPLTGMPVQSGVPVSLEGVVDGA